MSLKSPDAFLDGAVQLAARLKEPASKRRRTQYTAVLNLLHSLATAADTNELLEMWSTLRWKDIPNAPQIILASCRWDAIAHAPFDWFEIPSSLDPSQHLSYRARKNEWAHHCLGTYAEYSWTIQSTLLDNNKLLNDEDSANFFRTLFKHGRVHSTTLIASGVVGNTPQPTSLANIALSHAHDRLAKVILKDHLWSSEDDVMTGMYCLFNRQKTLRDEYGCQVFENIFPQLLTQSPRWFIPVSQTSHVLAHSLMGASVDRVPERQRKWYTQAWSQVAQQLAQQPLSTQKAFSDLVSTWILSVDNSKLRDDILEFCCNALDPSLRPAFAVNLLKAGLENHPSHVRAEDRLVYTSGLLKTGVSSLEGTVASPHVKDILLFIKQMGVPFHASHGRLVFQAAAVMAPLINEQDRQFFVEKISALSLLSRKAKGSVVDSPDFLRWEMEVNVRPTLPQHHRAKRKI